jgi:hypothetical protein
VSHDGDGGPIFIGGIAGTGKTRVATILGSHSRIEATRKTYLWRDFYGRCRDLADPHELTRYLDSVLESRGVQRLGIDPDRIRREFAAGPATYENLFALIHCHNAEANGKARWCDQLGMVEAYADPIFRAYPDTKMVHMVRDPRALRASGSSPGRVGWMTGRWLTSIEYAERNRERYGGRYLVVRAEDVEADEESSIRAVCEFLGETFEPAMVATGGPNPSMITGEVSTAEAASRRFVETTAGPAMVRQGYAISDRKMAPDLRYRLLDWPTNRLTLAAWRRVKAPSIVRLSGGAHG